MSDVTISWPKNPKLEDVIKAVDTLTAAVNQLEKRISAIEETANGNKERLDRLDAFETQHSAGAVHRQQEVDRLRADSRRMRWAMRTGRKP